MMLQPTLETIRFLLPIVTKQPGSDLPDTESLLLFSPCSEWP